MILFFRVRQFLFCGSLYESVLSHGASVLWEHVKDMARHSGCTLDFGVGFLIYIWAHENSYLVFFFLIVQKEYLVQCLAHSRP